MRYNVLVEESFQNARQGKVQILDSYAPSTAPQFWNISCPLERVSLKIIHQE